MKRIQRCMKIRELIEKEPYQWTAGKLALYLGVSKLRIKQDIQELRDSGVKINGSHKGYCVNGYCIEPEK